MTTSKKALSIPVEKIFLTRTPMFQLELGGQTYEVFQPVHLPEFYYGRWLASRASLVRVLETFQSRSQDEAMSGAHLIELEEAMLAPSREYVCAMLQLKVEEVAARVPVLTQPTVVSQVYNLIEKYLADLAQAEMASQTEPDSEVGKPPMEPMEEEVAIPPTSTTAI